MMKKIDIAHIFCSAVMVIMGVVGNAQNWEESGSFYQNYLANGYTFSTCLNGDGTVWATGCGATGTTTVRVKDGDNWNQLGSVIQDEFHLGCALSLNKAGNVLVISDPYYHTDLGVNSGKISVFELINNFWFQKGSTIFGIPSYFEPNGGSTGFADQMGHSVEIDNSGNTIAIASPYSKGTGEVRVYAFSEFDWVLKGKPFVPTSGTLFLQYGKSISLSADGNTLAIGSMNLVEEAQAGLVEVYEYKTAGWQPKGSVLVGAALNDCFGQSIVMSDDANSIIVSSPYLQNAPLTSVQSVYAQVFTFKNGDWYQKGQNLVPKVPTGGNDYMVRISGNGKIIVLADVLHGIVETFAFDPVARQWNAACEPIHYLMCVNFEKSLALNDTGTVLAVGSNAAQFVYENKSLESTFLNIPDEITLSPNPTQNVFYINHIDEQTTVEIQDVNGKVVLRKIINPLEDAIDLSGMALGMYVVKFVYRGQEFVKKVLLN